MNKAYVYKRRLLSLADLLMKLPKNRFDYSTWVGDDWEGKPDLSCGTTACAFGHATTIPALRKAGLFLYNSPSFGAVPATQNSYNKHFDNNVLIVASAAKEIFDLSMDEYEFLFVPTDHRDSNSGLNSNATAKQVAKHIRDFVKKKYK